MSFLDRLFRRKSGLSCHQVAAVLQEYLDKELDAAEVPKVLEHLEQCRDCGLEADLYERIKSSLHGHQQAPDADSMARIRSMAEELAANGPPEGASADI